MLYRLFSRAARHSAAPQAHRLPDDHRVYAVGDIHGRLDCLERLEDRIRAHEATMPAAARTTVIFLGDYIDRGPDSRGVLDRLARGGFAGLPAQHLLGNHEDALLSFLDDESDDGAWLGWGGIATLASYGIRAPERRADLAVVRRELTARMPSAHRRFLDALEVSILLGTHLFVHAGIRPGVDLAHQRREDLLGIRAPFLGGRPSPLRVVHGHTIVAQAVTTPDCVSLDTGAYITGRLSCAMIEGETTRLLEE